MLKIKIRGDSVEAEGATREVEFYDRFDVVADDGRALFTLRVREDGSLDIETGMMCVRHGGRLLDSGFTVRRYFTHQTRWYVRTCLLCAPL